MRYWWANQNQTFNQEIAGGYLWSPKHKANGNRNPYYEFMREVSPGDLILSFADTYIRKIGIARSHCYESPKPPEFGGTGPNWSEIGWKIEVDYLDPVEPFRPSEHMGRLAPLLPERYSPLRPNGHGMQSVYLTEIPLPLMEALAELIGQPVRELMRMERLADDGLRNAPGLLEWEEHLETEIETNATLGETERKQLVLARRGQGRFKENVRVLEFRCRVTGVTRDEHLRASHIRPWRDSDNNQRLDGENGLLLTPSIDHLFDRGFISFENNGRLIVSPAAHRLSLQRMGVGVGEEVNVGGFSAGQREYLDYHRNEVFLEARTRHR